MKISKFQRCVLLVAGTIAAAVGGFILVAPYTFYEGYGITLAANPDLLSELRAPAANLFVMGVAILAGQYWKSLLEISVATAFIVFIAFPLGRIVSIFADGMPSQSVLNALIIELVVLLMLSIAFAKRPPRRALVKDAASV